MFIVNKQLDSVIQADKINYLHVCKLGGLISHLKSNTIDDQWYIWKYIKNLRYAEFYKSRNGVFSYLMRLFFYSRLRKYGQKTGFQIPPNTIGRGLTIWHWGTIIINPTVKIGCNCTLYPGVLIGHKAEGLPAPRIGNNVFIGSGSKIIGDIEIGDNVIIGPNTVIVKNVPSNTTVVGNPARIIKQARKKVNIIL